MATTNYLVDYKLSPSSTSTQMVKGKKRELNKKEDLKTFKKIGDKKGKSLMLGLKWWRGLLPHGLISPRDVLSATNHTKRGIDQGRKSSMPS